LLNAISQIGDGFSELGVVILHNSEADRLDPFAREGYSVLHSF
jgi:hypothetical protein